MGEIIDEDATVAHMNCSEQDESFKDLGRIIVKAYLTCRDQVGIEALENHSLELRVHQREIDAAKYFLEELNMLKPYLVHRYLDPLARRLRRHVQDASQDIARKAYHVTGDLNEIVSAQGP